MSRSQIVLYQSQHSFHSFICFPVFSSFWCVIDFEFGTPVVYSLQWTKRLQTLHASLLFIVNTISSGAYQLLACNFYFPTYHTFFRFCIMSTWRFYRVSCFSVKFCLIYTRVCFDVVMSCVVQVVCCFFIYLFDIFN